MPLYMSNEEEHKKEEEDIKKAEKDLSERKKRLEENKKYLNKELKEKKAFHCKICNKVETIRNAEMYQDLKEEIDIDIEGLCEDCIVKRRDDTYRKNLLEKIQGATIVGIIEPDPKWQMSQYHNNFDGLIIEKNNKKYKIGLDIDYRDFEGHMLIEKA